MVKKVIYVFRKQMAENHETGSRKPILTIYEGERLYNAHEIEIMGPSRLIYDHDKPRPDGTRCWIETEAPIKVIR